VTLSNSKGVVVRDISDLAHPTTRCVIRDNGPTNFRFVDATHISYIVTWSIGAGALYMADLQSQRTSLVRSWTDGTALYWVYAWSPDGKTMSYLSSNAGSIAWHVLSATGDLTLSRFEPIAGGSLDPNRADAMIGFSADGQYVAMEQTYNFGNKSSGQAAPLQIVRLSDHKLVYSRTETTMATWATGAGARLYFRTTSGVEAWDIVHGAVPIVPGLMWIHPSASADGARIAYTTADAKGNHFAGYLRVTDQPPVGIQVAQLPRAGAAFLNSSLIWYAEETSCAGSKCGATEARLTGRTYLNDLAIGIENASVITNVFDSWPHVGAA
jgi:hypothetical protein